MKAAERVRTTAEEKRLPPPAVRRALRLAAGLTEDDIAEPLGVNRATVARWELGIREPRGALRRAYREVLEELTRR